MPQISDFNTVSLEVLDVLYSRNMVLLLSRIVGPIKTMQTYQILYEQISNGYWYDNTVYLLDDYTRKKIDRNFEYNYTIQFWCVYIAIKKNAFHL